MIPVSGVKISKPARAEHPATGFERSSQRQLQNLFGAPINSIRADSKNGIGKKQANSNTLLPISNEARERFHPDTRARRGCTMCRRRRIAPPAHPPKRRFGPFPRNFAVALCQIQAACSRGTEKT